MDGKHFSSPTRRHEGEPVFRRHWPNGISKFVKTVKLRPAIKNSLFVILHFVIHLLPAAILARLRWIGVKICVPPGSKIKSTGLCKRRSTAYGSHISIKVGRPFATTCSGVVTLFILKSGDRSSQCCNPS